MKEELSSTHIHSLLQQLALLIHALNLGCSTSVKMSPTKKGKRHML